MTNIVNPALSWNYPGITSRDLIYLKAVMVPDIQNLFRILPGIKSKQQLNLVNPLGEITKAVQDCGDKTVTGGPATIVSRTIETKHLEIYLEQCYSDFNGTIFEQAFRTGVNVGDLSGTQIGQILINLVQGGVQRDIFKLAFFGDTDSVDSYLNPMDGLWTIIQNQAGYGTQQIDAITALNQTTGTRAIDYLRAMYEEAPMILKQTPLADRRFLVTQNVYDNLLHTYQVLGETNGLLINTINGMQSLSFNGIAVVPLLGWDQWIAAKSLGDPVRILYTDITNHVIGVDADADFFSFRIKFDEDVDKMKIFGKYRMGYQFVQDDLQCFSIGTAS